MKTKYLIDNKPVANLRQWCKDNKQSEHTFYYAVKLAKSKGAKDCTCKGHYIVRVERGE